MDMNPYEMDSGYPDSVHSSPRTRETDSDHRWEARDSAEGFRYRLMCSYGGKIQQHSHDNHLSYVGGDTHVLAVDRNIRLASMNAKLSSLWGTEVSFKYQLPHEDLDALVSVTNDEDMENMMAECDNLHKTGHRFSRLRLFVFANKPDCSSQSSLGSLTEETKQENALQGPWINNVPLMGEKRGKMGVNLGRGFEQDSNLHAHSKAIDSSQVPKIGVLKTADRTTHINIQNQEQYTSEFSDVSSSLINERGPQQPQLQIPIQEFQKLQLRQTQNPIPWPVDDNANFNIPGRRIYSDTARAVNLSNHDMSKPNPVDQAYVPQHQQIQQNLSPSECYTQDQRPHVVSQSYWQMQEPHVDKQYQPVYFVHEGSPMLQQPMGAICPMGQPVPGSGGYYHPAQRMTYSPEAAPLSNPVTTVHAGETVHRQNGSDHREQYGTPIQTLGPVPKCPYTSVPSEPMADDVRVVYRPTAPVPLTHTEPYSYQNVVYEPNGRQIYYIQAPPATHPQYQLVNPDM